MPPASPALPPLHRTFLEHTVRDGGTEARYACACFVEQILADTAACRAAPAAAHTLLDEVRQACLALATAVATGPGQEVPHPSAAFLQYAMLSAVAQTTALWRAGAARGDATAEALLRHATDWKTPECYAYDLADLSPVHGQATAWLRETAPRGPVFVVGVRTGGSYLAPLWAAAVAARGCQAAAWTTLRPLRRAGRAELVPAETDRLPSELPPGTTIVAVDDQPDTGNTARAVRDALIRRFPAARDIVFASPGRVYHLDDGGLRPVVETSPVHTAPPRLWQSLAPADADRLTARARAHGILPTDGTRYRPAPFRGPFQERYGPSAGSGPNTDGVPAEPGPRRISPRNRPFSLVPDAGEDGAYHFRFVGTGPHGGAGARTLAALGEFLPPVRHHLDGYLVTAHEPGLLPLGHALAGPSGPWRRRALEAVVRYWRGLEVLGGLGEVDRAVVHDPRDRLDTALRRLRERLSGPLPVDGAWLDRHLPRRAALGGIHGRVLRTSLPYSHQSWHWRVKVPAGAHEPVAVRRFGLDWVWGGVGSLESEIASFVVENRLDGACLDELRAALADDPLLDAALELAGEALWWNVKSWLRRCPAPDAGAARRIREDLDAMARYVAGLR
uniref:Putative lividomycin production gene n=1 Tax=Streptomyces lividus TaxID=282216 RepID=Q2MF61_STRLV|nr:putative lividomycin production gene [Streptomyces lividus]